MTGRYRAFGVRTKPPWTGEERERRRKKKKKRKEVGIWGEVKEKVEREVRGGNGRKMRRGDEKQNSKDSEEVQENGNNRRTLWNWKICQGVSFIKVNVGLKTTFKN